MDKALTEQLFKAIEAGSFDMMLKTLEEGASLESTFYNEKGVVITPLHMACSSYHSLNIIKYILNKGIDVNFPDEAMATPLHNACCLNNNLETIAFLLERGAKIDNRDKNGETALHYASKHGRIEIIKYFGEQGGNLRIKDSSGKTMLHHVASSLHINAPQIIAYLISKDFDANEPDALNITPIVYAKKDETVSAIMPYISLSERAKKLLRDGINKNDYASVKEALLYGADPNLIYYPEKVSVLQKATDDNSVLIIELLLENGANVNDIDEYGNTALHMVRTIQAAECLISYGADVNSKTSSNITPLHKCIDNFNITKLLIENGAEVNCKDAAGVTPLFSAIENYNAYTKDQQKEIMKSVYLLLEYGADITVKASTQDRYSNVTVLHLAAKIGNLNLAKILIEKGANTYALDETNHLKLLAFAKNESMRKFLSEHYKG